MDDSCRISMRTGAWGPSSAFSTRWVLGSRFLGHSLQVSLGSHSACTPPSTGLGHQTWAVACHGLPGAIFKGQNKEALSSLVICGKH